MPKPQLALEGGPPVRTRPFPAWPVFDHARYLGEALSHAGGLIPLPDDPRVTRHARHLFITRYDPATFGGHTRQEFIAALQAEGITACSAGYNPLYRTGAIRRELARLGITEAPDCPVTERAAQEAVWFAQTVLLGDQGDMDSIVQAAAKIKQAWE